MTQTLKHRFVFSAMVAITILLVFLLGAINIINRVMVDSEIDAILTELVKSRGAYSPPTDQAEHRMLRRKKHMLPDAVMGARYFLVFYDNMGAISRTNVNHIYAVSDEQAREIGENADLNNPGMYGQFRYTVSDTPEGKKFAVFLDVSTKRGYVRTVLLASCGGGALCWALMLLLVTLLSRRAINPVTQSIEKQKQFVTNAGHELKTPLAIILTNTDALELHNGESKWSRNIRAQAIRLNGLMQNLLTLSKMDESAGKLPITQVFPGILLHETLELYESVAEDKNITVHAEICEDISLKANRESIVQLFSILLDNAVKYTPENGEIFLCMKKQDARILMKIENPWEYAGKEDPEMLFDRFYRGDSARTQSGGGYGIGLSAARAIVTAHGGTIKAEVAENGKNIVFTVRF